MLNFCQLFRGQSSESSLVFRRHRPSENGTRACSLWSSMAVSISMAFGIRRITDPFHRLAPLTRIAVYPSGLGRPGPDQHCLKFRVRQKAAGQMRITPAGFHRAVLTWRTLPQYRQRAVVATQGGECLQP